MSKRILVLGCGPAGLLAAHAAVERGHDVTIISKKQRSPIGGAQYLHSPIPGLPLGEAEPVSYVKIGTREGYAEKVYGSREASVSWDIFSTGEHEAWPMRSTYDSLWHRYEDKIIDGRVARGDIPIFRSDYNLVLSTVPRPFLCKHAHRFDSQHVVLIPFSHLGVDNVILYNGRESEPWYRTSKIFGQHWTEYAEARAPTDVAEGESTVRGIKPLNTDCNCHLNEVPGLGTFQPLGRFGQWRKAVLVTDAYEDARDAILRCEEGE